MSADAAGKAGSSLLLCPHWFIGTVLQSTSICMQVRTIPLDLCKADNCSKLLQQLKDTPIRVLIANAGGGPKTRALAPYW